MLRYIIEGGSLPVVICYPDAGQTICSESGSMSWMSPNMNMETTSGGGIKKALGRLISGDSIFLNEFTPQYGGGMIAFASSFPGSILPFELEEGCGIIVQKSAFLAMEKGLNLSLHFQKKLGAGFFGGEGFIMQKITGNGTAFIEIDGHCKEYQLAAGESIVLNTGYLAAMSESCSLDIQPVKGVKNVLFGGESFFNTVVTGPGKVYVQSMPISNMARSLAPYLPSSSGDGVNISFGD
ncbi:MAG: TIGR00266 family protein [Clostridia bacterium]|nr:TIGR00266 family protein [Clostridia bacterium]